MSNEPKKKLYLQWSDSRGKVATRDFERFRYLNVPLAAAKVSPESMRRNDGDRFALALYHLFHESTDWAGATKDYHYKHFTNYVVFCDGAGMDPRSKEGVNAYYYHVRHRHMLGQLKDGSCHHYLAAIKSVLCKLNCPADGWLDIQGEFSHTQAEPIEAYSKMDMKVLLSLITRMFNQLYAYIFSDSERYTVKTDAAISLEKEEITFKWRGEQFPVHAPVTKLACLSCYLVAYYTWGNGTQLFKVKRPAFGGPHPKEKWAKMPVYKGRGHRYVSIEIGENDSIDIACHAVRLFEKILLFSTLLDPGPDALLLLWLKKGKPTPLDYSVLWVFNRWLERTFRLRDDFGRLLRPQVQRFRASGISRLQAWTGGALEPAIVADNTPQIIEGPYATGNKYENDLEIQATSHTLESAARRRQGVPDAKEAAKKLLKVEVLPFEAFLNRLPSPSRNANGSYCRQPHGDRAAARVRKAMERNLLKPGERLACADLLGCFLCPDQVIVESVEELWCILSFRECLEESAYLHLSREHFVKNFGEILRAIDSRLAQVDHKILRGARNKLNEKGRHPEWLEPASIRIRVEEKDAQ
jgi:hypothetical protein